MAKKAPKKFNLLDHLEKEVKAEVFVAVIDEEGTELTFPNFLDLNWREAREFMDKLSSAESSANIEPLFAKWLSEEDFKKLEDSPISLKAAMTLAEEAIKHYSAVVGTPGE
ncbi:hypothetical protein [Glutamicibacter sp. TV12E]|uniref:hypothetical protein n=1 Tax=Glutamicibacter sp. TV12E TaxID=3446362 RepID=UPI0040340636